MEEKGLQKDEGMPFTRGFAAPQVALPKRTQPGQAEATGLLALVALAVGEETAWPVRCCMEGGAVEGHHPLGLLGQGCPGVHGDAWREKLQGISVWSQVTAGCGTLGEPATRQASTQTRDAPETARPLGREAQYWQVVALGQLRFLISQQ